MSAARPPSPVRLVVFVAIAAAALAVAWFSPARHYLEESRAEDLDRVRASFGAWAIPIYVVATAIGVAFGIPRSLFAALGGAIFGVVLATALCVIGAVAGSTATFAVGRALGREWVEARIRAQRPRLDRALADAERQGFLVTFALRSFPGLPSFVVSLSLSLTAIRWRSFLLGSLAGFIPSTALYAWMGTAARDDAAFKLFTGLAILVALALLGVVVARARRRAA